jgi:hypothetical protein
MGPYTHACVLRFCIGHGTTLLCSCPRPGTLMLLVGFLALLSHTLHRYDAREDLATHAWYAKYD